MINKINHPDCINTNTALCATIQVCPWLIILTYLELLKMKSGVASQLCHQITG